MSFWTALGDIGAGIAAPFTGGASLAFIPAINALTSQSGGQTPAGALGQAAGSIEQQRANALATEAALQQRQDANALADAKFNLGAPGELAGQSVRGDLLANAQDAGVSGLPSYIHVPTLTGGLRPSLFSAATRSLGGNLSSNALQQMQSGSYKQTPTPLPSSNAWDSILQGTAVGGGFLNALSGLNPNNRPDGSAGAVAGDNASDVQGGVNPEVDLAQNGMQNPLPGGTNVPDYGTSMNAGLDPSILQWWQQQATNIPSLDGGGS